MKKILLIDDSDTYTWCLQKYLQHRGYPVKTACTLKEARAAIQEEMPLVVCCDLDLPGMVPAWTFWTRCGPQTRSCLLFWRPAMTRTTTNRRLCAGARRCAWTK